MTDLNNSQLDASLVEEGWQPAVLANHMESMDCHWATSGTDGRGAANRGKIIRVRPSRTAYGERLFQIHPEDAELINAKPAEFLCEHMILTD